MSHREAHLRKTRARLQKCLDEVDALLQAETKASRKRGFCFRKKRHRAAEVDPAMAAAVAAAAAAAATAANASQAPQAIEPPPVEEPPRPKDSQSPWDRWAETGNQSWETAKREVGKTWQDMKAAWDTVRRRGDREEPVV